MEHALIIVLEWIGRIIAQRLAGSLVDSTWKKIFPALKNMLRYAAVWQKNAAAHITAAAELETAANDAAGLLDAATARIVELEAENAVLKAELKRLKSPKSDLHE